MDEPRAAEQMESSRQVQEDMMYRTRAMEWALQVASASQKLILRGPETEITGETGNRIEQELMADPSIVTRIGHDWSVERVEGAGLTGDGVGGRLIDLASRFESYLRFGAGPTEQPSTSGEDL